ncbi:MAG TPA: MCE family protein [Acidimicrobiales bacterium]|nr:MCE family protein [Acidimicrobiales bacterium]
MTFLARFRPATVLALAGLVIAALAVVGFLGVHAGLATPTRLVTAEFAEAPGLYVGNHVDVLGIPVGQIVSISAHPTQVTVSMRVDDDVKLPRNAKAMLMAPDLVNDRYVQLMPAYTSGALLPAGAVIPESRTVLPESVDQIISTLDQLVRALGPTGANAKGAVSQFVHDVAATVGGNGPNFKTTVTALSQALGAVAADSPTISSLLDNVGNFTGVAAANTQDFQAFANDAAGVTSVVASDDADIGTILKSLNSVVTQLTQFVQANQTSLGSTLANLQQFTSAIAAQQQQLAEAFDYAGLGLADVDNAITVSSSGTGALRIRYVPSTDTPAFISAVCGSEETRILALGLQQGKSSELNLACAASAALSQVKPPPDAPAGPNLTLSALIGAQP